jgi:hypothetical protein
MAQGLAIVSFGTKTITASRRPPAGAADGGNQLRPHGVSNRFYTHFSLLRSWNRDSACCLTSLRANTDVMGDLFASDNDHDKD